MDKNLPQLFRLTYLSYTLQAEISVKINELSKKKNSIAFQSTYHPSRKKTGFCK